MKRYVVFIIAVCFILFMPFSTFSQDQSITPVDIIQYLKNKLLDKPVVSKVDTIIVMGRGSAFIALEDNPTEYHQDSNSVLFVYYAGFWPLGKYQYTDSADAYLNFTSQEMKDEKKQAEKVPKETPGVITEVIYRDKKKQKNIFRLRFVPDKWKGTKVKPVIAFFLEKPVNEYSPNEIDNFVNIVFALKSDEMAPPAPETSAQGL
jgi:hypothetical protein